MVGIVVVSHSARLAEGVVELAREMAGDVALVAAGGLEPPAPGEPAPLGTDAARVMAAIEEAGGAGAGVLVLMDLGSAVLSAEMAAELLGVEPGGEELRLAAAPLVEGAVAAAVAAQAGGSLAEVEREALGGLAAKQAHLGAETQPPAAPASELRRSGAAGGRPVEARFVVSVEQGLHARPAARFVRAAAALDARIEVENATTGAGPAPAGSLNAIATLGVREGHELLVRATGPDAERALEELRAIAAPGEGGASASGAAGAARAAGATGAPARGTAEARAAVRTPPPDAPPGTLAGLPASPGTAIGPLRRLDASDARDVEIPAEPAGAPAEEWAALAGARDAVRRQIAVRRDRLAASAGPDEAEILDALALVLDDEAVLEPARRGIHDDRRSAARAWADAIGAIADRYAALEDAYQRERAADVRDVGRRVLAALAPAGGAEEGGEDAEADGPRPAPQEPAILAVHELTPLDAAGLDPATVAGIATAVGGPTSHGAILARALGVPAVVGLGDALAALPGETTAILDGGAGLLIPDPSAEATGAYAERRAREQQAAAEARAASHEPALTRDGEPVEVAANAGSAADAEAAAAAGADGVGLLRTEFAFLHRDAAPDEDEQAALYARAAAALGGSPLVIRTLDAGADKPLPYLGMPAEDNPFLGVRGLRLGLARPELLSTQLRAVLRAAAEHPNVKLMFPMVATLDELRAARALLHEARAAVGAEPREGFEVGIMVEVPAAALTAVQLAREVDFFSIGTNDLTQYALAAERGNAGLAALADGLHPAVLRLIADVCGAAQAHGRWVGVCGELAADPAAVPLLVGLGVRELSVATPSVPAVKAAVRALDSAEAAALAQAALAAESAAAVRALVVSGAPASGTP